MFTTSQIVAASKFIRNFRAIATALNKEPGPVLITRKNDKHLVLVNAEIFEDLVKFKLRFDGAAVPEYHIKDEL